MGRRGCCWRWPPPALWYWQARQTASAAPSYTTQPVARGNLTLTVTANGTLQPTRSINIGSELSGTVLKVNVDVNDRIKKGQVLVELDTAKLRDQILRSRAALAAAQRQGRADRRHGEGGAGPAWRGFEEVARLSGGKVPSKAELDSAPRDARARAWPTRPARAPASPTRRRRCPPTRSTCRRRRSARRPTAWC